MYANPIILRDLTIPVRQRHSAHCGPYHFTPQRSGPVDGWSTYESRGRLGSAFFSLRTLDANEILRKVGWYRHADIQGYYASDDNVTGETWVPLVVILPGGRGFLPAASLGEGMCATVDAWRFDTAEDAAVAAHETARDIAEKDREMDREFQDDNDTEGEN